MRRSIHRTSHIQRSNSPTFFGLVSKNRKEILLSNIPKIKELINRTSIVHQPNGDAIKETGDSLKKSRLIFGTNESAFIVSLKSNFSISPTAKEYLLVLF
jgi:hypothetical protein